MLVVEKYSCKQRQQFRNVVRLPIEVQNSRHSLPNNCNAKRPNATCQHFSGTFCIFAGSVEFR